MQERKNDSTSKCNLSKTNIAFNFLLMELFVLTLSSGSSKIFFVTTLLKDLNHKLKYSNTRSIKYEQTKIVKE